MSLWRNLLDLINIYLSRLWIKQITLHCGGASLNQLKALREKTEVSLRKEELCLQTALGLKTATSVLPWVSSLPAHPAGLRLASIHNHVNQILKQISALSLSLSLSLSNSYLSIYIYSHTYIHINIHKHNIPLAWFLWRTLIYYITLNTRHGKKTPSKIFCINIYSLFPPSSKERDQLHSSQWFISRLRVRISQNNKCQNQVTSN